MKFSPQKSLLIKIILLFFTGFFLHSVWMLIKNPGVFIWYFIVIALSFAFILWIYFDTSYYLDEEAFIYRSGPFKGRIPIENIRKVTKHSNYMFVGLKASLGAKNGLIIHYNKYDEIFISPVNKELFLQKLQELNSSISISKEE